AAWLHYTFDPANGLLHSRNCAQSEGTNYRIDGVVLQGNALSGKTQKFDIQLCSARCRCGKLNHRRIRFERIDLAHSCGIVVNEVHAWAYAYLEDLPLSQGDNPPANFPYGLRIAQHAYEMGVDMISVERHTNLRNQPSCSFRPRSKVPRCGNNLRRLALPTDGYDFKVFRLDMGCPVRGAVMF